MSVIDLLFGRPLSSSEGRAEKLGSMAGIPVFGLDALSSAAYGPEAALALLMGLGALGVVYIIPLTVCIVILLLIVYFSYRQTIEAYPQGGGSYTVAGQNLGPFAGLLAASALMIDYVLTAAVGISAGVGALVSALPSFEPHTLGICLLILLLILLINLRGARDTGIAFMAPTYLFVGTLLFIIILGVAKSLIAGGHPQPIAAPPPLHAATAAVGLWLLLKAFSSGCTAMTGVEAVSNGVTAFREPVVKAARRTLGVVIGLLVAMLLGIAYLCHTYQVGATKSGLGYQSVLSQLTAAVIGRNAFYFITIGSILLVLSLSANTAFADFPRLCRMIAEDRYLPVPLAERGRRLVYSVGIVVLAILTGALLLLFRGVTDRLIPLYAVGAFLAFTLSQAGMVAHWVRERGREAKLAIAINGLGAIATAGTVVIVTITKFASGAWITTLVIPCLLLLMFSIRRHYDRLAEQIASSEPLDISRIKQPVVVLPVLAWNRVVRTALQVALTLSSEIHILHVATDEEHSQFLKSCGEFVKRPIERAGLPSPKVTVLRSPYRFVINPIVDYVLELNQKMPERQIALIIPELVEKHWYQYFLHNQRAQWLKATVLLKGRQGIIVVNVPWYLDI